MSNFYITSLSILIYCLVLKRNLQFVSDMLSGNLVSYNEKTHRKAQPGNDRKTETVAWLHNLSTDRR